MYVDLLWIIIYLLTNLFFFLKENKSDENSKPTEEEKPESEVQENGTSEEK